MDDGDVDGKVLVWHVFQGAMVVPWWKYGENRFYGCWMPLKDHEAAWIGTGDRLPAKGDADPMNCVMALTREEETVVTGYHQMRDRQRFTHWRPLPCPPAGAAPESLIQPSAVFPGGKLGRPERLAAPAGAAKSPCDRDGSASQRRHANGRPTLVQKF